MKIVLLFTLLLTGCSTIANLYDPSGASQSNRYAGRFTSEKHQAYRQCSNMARNWGEIDACMKTAGYEVAP